MQGQTPTTLSQMAGSVGYTMSSSTGSGLYVWANQSSSAVSTFGDSLVLSGFTGGATAIGLQLDAPYIAVRGMSTSTPAPAVTQVPAALSGTMTLSVLLQNGQTTTETIANPYSSNGLNPLGFFGFTASSPIQSVTLSTTPGSSGAPGDFAGTTYPMVSEVDMSTANVAAVPEPSSYALLLAGLAVVGGIATRRSGRTQAR
ncbi:MAG: PEP-CTERM sorting domain-containing protein [Paucibacter sp.]|nr:PEP-CTERM sorting domain-containing protein [Roseateles sp.]